VTRKIHRTIFYGGGHTLPATAYCLMTTNGPTTDIPVACNLEVFSKAELEDHISLSLDLIFRLPKTTQELADGFLFEYVGSEELFLKLARFVHDEHRCCSWAGFAIEMAPFAVGTVGTMRLRYTSGPEGKALLAESLKVLGAAADDPAARARLHAAVGHFKSIAPSNKDDFFKKLKAACGC
jgi:hypothetical protein